MKYYIIAGEASGDLQGSNLIKAILAKDTNAQIRCWGVIKWKKQVEHLEGITRRWLSWVLQRLLPILTPSLKV